MLTIEDIRNPNRVSGFDHTAELRRGARKYFQATLTTGTLPHRVGPILRATTRKTAEEAAQDYCDFMNAGKCLTPEMLYNPQRKSGYNYVSIGGGGRGFQGSRNGGGRPDGWRGPLRKTALQAARDYCDHVNGQQVSTAPALNRVDKAQRPKRRQRAITDRERLGARMVAEEKAKNPVEPMHPPLCYLVGVKGDASFAVKVGESKTDVMRRVEDDLQTGNPRQLVLLATLLGGEETEQRLHAKYAKDNVLNEWFRPTRELLSEFGLSTADYIRKVSR